MYILEKSQTCWAHLSIVLVLDLLRRSGFFTSNIYTFNFDQYIWNWTTFLASISHWAEYPVVQYFQNEYLIVVILVLCFETSSARTCAPSSTNDCYPITPVPGTSSHERNDSDIWRCEGDWSTKTIPDRLSAVLLRCRVSKAGMATPLTRNLGELVFVFFLSNTLSLFGVVFAPYLTRLNAISSTSIWVQP